MPKKLTIVEFVRRAKNVFGDRFDYEKIIYKNMFTKIEIYCKEHKSYFFQEPQNHLNGHIGCPICVTPRKPRDFSGQIIGNYFVIGLSDKKYKNNLWWNVKCITCNNETIKNTSSILAKNKCRNCLGMSKSNSGLNRIYSQYKYNAKKFNRAFEFNISEFSKITSDNCYYCGRSPSNIHKTKNEWGYYTYNGIDRIDNNKHYTIDNCRTCCKFCNRAKYALKEIDFLIYLKDLIVKAKSGELDHIIKLSN